MSSEQVVTPEDAEASAPQPKSGRGLSPRWFLLIGAVILFNIVALIFVPPFPKEGAPGDACAERRFIRAMTLVLSFSDG